MKKALTHLVLIIGFVNSIIADEVPIPSAIAVLGDSISEGMMTDYSLERPPSLFKVASLINSVQSYTGLERMNFVRKVFAKKYHSWATGSDSSDYVFSHFERLKTLSPELKGFNFAVSGSKTEDMKTQIDELLETEQKENILIDYILVLFGSNDLKSESVETVVQPPTFASNIEANVKRLLNINPRRNILLVGIPKIHDIMEKSQKYLVYNFFGKKIRCDGIRKSIYGNAVYFNPQDQESFNQSRMIAEMYRNEIDILADKLKAEYPLAHIKTVQNYDAPSLVFKSLSIDCFHPSTLGQALLAEVTWIYGFWPELVTEEDYQ